MSMGHMQDHFANNRTTWLNAVALLVLIAVYATYKVGQRRPASESFAKDPICGMQVAVSTASVVLELGDETYYFCCDGCKEKFATNQS
jgi:YHS domain-containing protein